MVMCGDVVGGVIRRTAIPVSRSSLWLAIAAVLAPLLSIVILPSVPLGLIALRKHRRATLRSRLTMTREFTATPVLSTASDGYFRGAPDPSHRSRPFHSWDPPFHCPLGFPPTPAEYTRAPGD